VPLRLALKQRSPHRRAGDDPSARVRVAWEESLEELAVLGAVRRPEETQGEFADRVAEQLPGESRSLRDLARTADAATFAVGAGAVAAPEADRAEITAEEMATTIRSRSSRRQRLRRRLDPRPLVTTGHGSPRKAARTSRR
jgi:hypothetical protein